MSYESDVGSYRGFLNVVLSLGQRWSFLESILSVDVKHEGGREVSGQERVLDAL